MIRFLICSQSNSLAVRKKIFLKWSFYDGENQTWHNKSVSHSRNLVDYKHAILKSSDVNLFKLSVIHLCTTRNEELFKPGVEKLYLVITKHKMKKANRFAFLKESAEGGIRTHTGVSPHGPEPCASASFTTSAFS